MNRIAPLGTNQFKGDDELKPWQYQVSVCIAHLDTIEPLKVVLDVLRHQTIWPYIMVVDTGSSDRVCRELEKLRSVNVEIHYIKAHAYENSSEPVTAALDLCHSLCRTEYLFHTHSDVFLMRDELLKDLIALVNENRPVAGYRMSPRDWATRDWEWMVGHTATMLHMPTIFKSGASWSIQKMHEVYGVPYSIANGWPDTETGFNYDLRKAGIVPCFLGDDTNFERYTDHNIDHARSYSGSKVYNPKLFKKAEVWMRDAMKQAQKRLSLTRTRLRLQLPSRPLPNHRRSKNHTLIAG